MSARRDRAGPDPGKAAHPRPAGEAHENCLGLVFGMMRGDNGVDAALFRPISEQQIALFPSALLDRGLWNFGPARREDRMRYAEPSADLGNHLRLAPRFLPESMVNGRRFDLIGPGSRSK